MTKVSDSQAVILSAAAQRDDGAVLPLPETLKLKGGAVDKVLGSLKAKGLIDHQGSPRGDDPPPLRITRAGLQAIGVETEADAPEGATPADTGATPTEADAPEGATPADTGATPAEAGVAAVETPDPVTGADSAAPPKRKSRATKVKGAESGTAAPAGMPAPRAGTKQALLIEMLKRPEGATVEQIAAVTGWQKHTIRGAISGALKKTLGLTVEATRTPDEAGAKGRSTVYRITGSGPQISTPPAAD
jgi:Protein of unknown function (DUF3489)